MSLKYLTLALAVIAAAAPGSPYQALEAQASSDNPCEPCQPSGATGTDPPAVGSDLSSLYVDVLSSVQGISFNKRGLTPRAATSGFCCVASLNCVNVQSLNIPMCYDKFTTNFKFPDGSYGSLTTGDYVSNGQTINLLSGDYSGGNIYSAAPQDKPDTSTLSVPAQYTGTGVGAAIPASELGSVIVYTTTIPGTTFTAPTTVPGTVRAATVNGLVVSTSIAPQTIIQATTVAPQTTVVTTQAPDASAAASSKGAAGVVGVDSSKSFGVSVLGALMYFLM
ncbi:hypothetical protein BU25DRAFT_197534 [Macroventuria anomochaeta]|uniref:Uncharacterized protein n=1 Tax=Macroventuria anomochaeta TaxID=301207 RepID=A0ACB6SCU0_9PLEO|nr:uncharacterized protein BU25DRAFT_197534 [Macroventuria anomochaeta]KAF2631818.1 hypothetical protein BU25DRAFT_197534 [Macroventuria anomochaeta]